MTATGADLTRAGVRRVLLTTLALNVLVSAGKIVVGKLTGSLAMVADGFHSMVDGVNNVAGLVLTGFAYAPPDAGHPYGHRKFENAASILLGLGLLGVAWHVVQEAIRGAAGSQAPAVGVLNWAVMLGTLAVNFGVARYEAREGNRLGSAFLQADAAHTRSDIFVTLGVLASFAADRAGLRWADPLAAGLIAAFIAVMAVRILVGSFHTLTDRAVFRSDALAPLILQVADVRSCKEIRTRGGPGAVYVDLVIHVDGNMSLLQAHAVADQVEAALMRAHPEIVDVVVHVEPAGRP
ncbi:MAG TPA: cation diffusion facilitator family transporter [Vicinamibacteria bacterium]|nr:cation diffusion facilitator family transporter [Vicinamibacteria bacterium]